MNQDRVNKMNQDLELERLLATASKYTTKRYGTSIVLDCLKYAQTCATERGIDITNKARKIRDSAYRNRFEYELRDAETAATKGAVTKVSYHFLEAQKYADKVGIKISQGRLAEIEKIALRIAKDNIRRMYGFRRSDKPNCTR